jgi:hypothetical protein
VSSIISAESAKAKYNPREEKAHIAPLQVAIKALRGISSLGTRTSEMAAKRRKPVVPAGHTDGRQARQ